MRQIDWGNKLSDEDVTWLRQSGIRYAPDGQPLEDAIRTNQQSSYEAPPTDDTTTRSALDTTAAGATPLAALDVDEQRERLGGELDSDSDDYDEWKKDELVAEIEERNQDRAEPMSTSGTKAELIARLREDDAA